MRGYVNMHTHAKSLDLKNKKYRIDASKMKKNDFLI